MTRSFKKGTVTFKAVNEDKRAENVSFANLVEEARDEDIKEVGTAIGTLISHPITETELHHVYHVE